MDSALVIKVKYGDTLRRFTSYVDNKGLRDLDMARLKHKIQALFNLPSDLKLTLTYTDEDKDEVTLVDDNDLYDATRLKLNPMRITVAVARRPRFGYTSAIGYGLTDSDCIIRLPNVCPNLKVGASAFSSKFIQALSKMKGDCKANPFIKNLSRPSFPCQTQQLKAPADLSPIKRCIRALISRSNSVCDVLKAPEALSLNDRGSHALNVRSSPCQTEVLKTHEALCPIERGMLALNNKRKNDSGEVNLLNSNHINNGRAYDMGIQCDGCQVYPIRGRRYKSKVKDDYDLCSMCFASMGNEAEYEQVDAFLLSSADRHQTIKATRTCNVELVNTLVTRNSAPPETGLIGLAAESANDSPAFPNRKSRKRLRKCYESNDLSGGARISAPIPPASPAAVSTPVGDPSLVKSEPSADVNPCSTEKQPITSEPPLKLLLKQWSWIKNF